MIRRVFLLSLLALIIPLRISADELAERFITPAGTPTSCYWYWVSDNISKEGIVADLHAMKAQGITRAFIGNQGIEDLPRGDVRFGSDEWWNIMHTALKTASELGIEIGIFNGPGWSHMGGAWVKPEESMRYLGTQRMYVNGDNKATLRFPHPDGWLCNVRLLAFPNPKPVSTVERDFDTKIYSADTTIQLKSMDPDFVLRSIWLYPASRLRCHVAIDALVDGNWKELKQFDINRTNLNINIGYDIFAPIAEATPPTAAQDFRLRLSGISGEQDAPEVIGSILLSSEAVVSNFAEKKLARMHQTGQPMWHDYKWQPESYYSTDEVVDPACVIDITDRLHGDEVEWNEKGSWTLVRTYMAPTGIDCAPAFDGSGRGPEVDRWNHEALVHHYDSFMGEIERRIPPEDRRTWTVVVCDSYETATQNFGDDFFEYFTARYGYDPTPWLPAYHGFVVGSQEQTDRFLWDVRRMIADRLADDNIATMDSIARAHGKHLWLENYGHWGFPGEFLQYGSRSTEIAGEFWSTGSLGDIENRAASSSAHTYGKRLVSAESFTFSGKDYQFSPREMKARGDRFFSEGINNTLLHVVVSQPSPEPTDIYQPWFGNEFNHKNPWYDHLHLFTDYLKRCNILLQEGVYVADVAYFIGEDTPCMTGITEPQCPEGVQYDFINAEVLRDRARVVDGDIVLPEGNRYRLLVLPPSATMRPETLRAIKRLIDDGATVLGNVKPLRSPSLQGYPQCDTEVRALADEMWGETMDNRMTQRTIGRGQLLYGYNFCPMPDDYKPNSFMVREGNGTLSFADEKVKCCEVRNDSTEIFFIANQTTEPLNLIVGLNNTLPYATVWSPADGAIESDWRVNSVREPRWGGTMTLAPLESKFVVFSRKGQVYARLENEKDELTLTEPWKVRFTSSYGIDKTLTMKELTDWTALSDDDLQYLGGKAVYTTTFKIKGYDKEARYVIDLGTVNNQCEVSINGKAVGGAWTYPYRVDITEAVKKGNNTLEVEVSNNLANRLIGDKRNPDNKVINISRNTWKAGDELQPSGMTGPARIIKLKPIDL